MEKATEQARRPVRFHLLTGPTDREKDSAEAVLRTLGVTHASLRAEGSSSGAEGVLTGVAEEPVLIQVLLALVHDLRHGLFVCLNGPEDLVIRCNDTVGQGRILLRTGDGDIEACDAEGLSGALSAIARAVPVVQARASYAASTMFADVQNRELAADAIRLMRVFTDPDFLRRADPGGDDPLYDPRWLVERNSLPRHFLDLLLLTHAMSPAAAGPGATRDGDHEGMTTAAAIASKVEVFVASSAAVESGTLARPLPDGGIGFLIALPALASEVMANLAWALPTLLAPARVAGFSSGDHDLLGARRALDDSLASYLASRRPRRSTAPLPTPRPVIPMAMPDTATPNGSDDPSVVFKASSLFLIARELVPILFGGSRAGVPGTRLPLSTAGLPKETRLEMWADQEAYGLTISALVAGSGEHEPYIPDFDNITRSLRSGRLPVLRPEGPLARAGPLRLGPAPALHEPRHRGPVVLLRSGRHFRRGGQGGRTEPARTAAGGCRRAPGAGVRIRVAYEAGPPARGMGDPDLARAGTGAVADPAGIRAPRSVGCRPARSGRLTRVHNSCTDKAR